MQKKPKIYGEFYFLLYRNLKKLYRFSKNFRVQYGIFREYDARYTAPLRHGRHIRQT